MKSGSTSAYSLLAVPVALPICVGWLSGSATNGIRLAAFRATLSRANWMPVPEKLFDSQTYGVRPVKTPTPPRTWFLLFACDVPVEAEARRELGRARDLVGGEVEELDRSRVRERLVGKTRQIDARAHGQRQVRPRPPHVAGVEPPLLDAEAGLFQRVARAREVPGVSPGPAPGREGRRC